MMQEVPHSQALPTQTGAVTPGAETLQNALTQPEDTHHAAEVTFLGFDATGWVSVAMVLLVLIAIWKKAPHAIARSLDARVAAIRTQLDEARTLRAEAEALFTEAEARQKAATADAAAIIAHAEQEAAILVDKARGDADALVERRRRMAEDKIAAAERQAVDSVRQAAADAAAKAARTVIRSQVGAAEGSKLVDDAIAGIRLH